MLELYHNHTSVCAAKVRMALEEKGLAWTGRQVDIFNGEQHKPDYLRLNPLGVVPTLVRDGSVFIESTIINEYIARQITQDEVKAKLKERAREERLRIKAWCDAGALTGPACAAPVSKPKVGQ